ncbi:MAG: DUF4199 domain-containing protein [Thermonemataceae bacterium]|nr:DUF4199 domain-containing protein [Thermonemataceae bacterium]
MAESITPTSVGLRYGLFYGLVSIILTTLTFVIESLSDSFISTVLSFGIWITFLVLAAKFFKDQSSGYMSFGQGFQIGLLVSVISSVLSGLYYILYLRVLSPETWNKIMDKVHSQWEKQGLDEKSIEMAEKFTSPEISFLGIVIGGLVMGAILSLVVAAIMQKKKPEF